MRDRISAEELREFVRQNRTKRKMDPLEASAVVLRAATEIDMLNDALGNARSHGEADNPDEAALLLLRQARETADAALASATSRALEIEREARVAASKIVTDAEHQSKGLLTEVEREAQAARTESQERVVSLVTEAEQHAAAVVEEAELRAASLNEEAERRRAETEAECEQMRLGARAEVAELADRLAALDSNYRASVGAIRAEATRLQEIATTLEGLRGADAPDEVAATPSNVTHLVPAADVAESDDAPEPSAAAEGEEAVEEQKPSFFNFFEARG